MKYLELAYAYLYDFTIGNIRQYYRKICRSLAFARIGWDNFDFDYRPLVELELFKLKRMLHLFENSGYHSEECPNYKPKMKSIRLAIKLGERWLNHDYCKFHDLHEKKWGKLQTNLDNPLPEDYTPEGNLRWRSWRNGAKTEEEKRQEHLEFFEAVRKDDRLEERDIKNFYKILAKYSRYYWD